MKMHDTPRLPWWYYQFFSPRKRRYERYLQMIAATVPASERIRILDVGAGDSVLYHPVVNAIAPQEYHVDVVDPVESTAGRAPLEMDTNRHFRMTIEEFIAASRSGTVYDLIIMSHVMYYIPYESWLSLIANLVSRLSDHGTLLIFMCSRTAPVYRSPLWPTANTTRRLLGLRKPSKMLLAFSEDLESLLAEVGLPFEADVLRWRGGLTVLSNGLGPNDSIALDLVKFLYRLPAQLPALLEHELERVVWSALDLEVVMIDRALRIRRGDEWAKVFVDATS